MEMKVALDIPMVVQRELNDLLVGKLIGSGQYRAVYGLELNERLVIKFESDDTGKFCNVAEWHIWQQVKDDPDLARWFAPCRYISYSGSVLIMDRTKPIKTLPDMLPDFLGDLKPKNFGRLRGRIVCHDYGLHEHIIRGGFKRWRMASTSYP